MFSVSLILEQKSLLESYLLWSFFVLIMKERRVFWKLLQKKMFNKNNISKYWRAFCSWVGSNKLIFELVHLCQFVFYSNTTRKVFEKNIKNQNNVKYKLIVIWINTYYVGFCWQNVTNRLQTPVAFNLEPS